MLRLDLASLMETARQRVTHRRRKLEVIADMHTHSRFSVDGMDDMMTMCRAAACSGMRYICFTEHLDMNPGDEGFGYFAFERFSRAIDAARGELGDTISILKGLEFGEPHLYPKEFEAVLKKDFDVILGAVHWIGESFVDDKELEKNIGREGIFEKYYTEVLKATRFGGFDILAHLDFPKRYMKTSYNELDLVDEILFGLSESGIVLEINSSPLRKGLNECSPDKDILERYVKQGGKRVSLGSDAHFADDIGAGLEQAEKLAGENGLETGIFQQRRFLPFDGNTSRR